MDSLNILLLCVPQPSGANTISDHINAFLKFSTHRIFVLQNYAAIYGSFRGKLSALPQEVGIEHFDVLVIHYSNYLVSDDHLDAPSRSRIRQFAGLKILFIQDEYRQINLIRENIRDLGFHVIFSCVPEQEIEKVYPAKLLPGIRKVNNLTGYVPADLTQLAVPPIRERPVDVGYRTRKVPYWLGKLGTEKWRIAPQFLEATRGSGLICDLSYEEKDRLYGRKWTNFILSCKAVLGVESGASVFDFTGNIQRRVEQYLLAHPNASYEEVSARFRAQDEGQIYLNQISPRCFEAAALRTAMVLFEGRYSGILEPWRHYVPLKKDFSNIDEVVAVLKDRAALQRIVDQTYKEIALNPLYSYRHFIAGFDQTISREIGARVLKPSVAPYTNKEFLLPLLRLKIFLAKLFLLILALKLWSLATPNMRQRAKVMFPRLHKYLRDKII